MLATDETNITEIELLPDGRICVFGASLEVLDVLDELQGGTDSRVRQRLNAKTDTQQLLESRQPPALPGVRPTLDAEDSLVRPEPPAEPGAVSVLAPENARVDYA